ncbi:hypothetical protein AOQ84DRAFT_403376 [Glonium stellatum]|uniref:PKS/mFAS DH domain-containing protein n=1 Tax=Glonium stellatum TaxID=574774 RepID=A0A8E2JUP9_9PEZI|nr:hypothetical protein AOQ84DRAFT_403376 [Glonium stellatum]
MTWYESRLSSNFRNRKHPRHDLFGAPVPDWNPDQLEWRHFLRLLENPWMKDHVVTGSYVYPGVGYIIMAIEAEAQAWADALKESHERCQTPSKVSYDNLEAIGLAFGRLFQNLSGVRANEETGEVTATITVPDVAKSMPKGHMHSHMIHPSTMDRFNKHSSDITVWDSEIDERRLSVKGFQTTLLGTSIASAVQARKLCHSIEWKPDLDMLNSTSYLPGVSLVSSADNEAYKSVVEKLQLASMLLITDAIKELQASSLDSLEEYRLNYYEWCKLQAEALQQDSIPHLTYTEWERYNKAETLKEKLYSEVTALKAGGTLLVRMGKNIADTKFQQDNLLNHVYTEMVEVGNLPSLFKAYLEVVRHNSTDLNILEVGAGTGGLTASLLEILSPRSGDEATPAGSSVIAKYTYTDISAAFFEKAQERFKSWRNVLDFKTFNLERDAADQGIELGSYDYIVAGNVIHATADLTKSLANLKHLLKPGGRLIMHEAFRREDSIASILKEILAENPGIEDCVIVHYSKLGSMNLTDAVCISLLDLERSAFLDLQEDTYDSIRHLLTTCDGALWVTRDVDQHPSQGSATRPLVLDITSPGLLNSLNFATDPVWYRPLAARDVEVEIKAVGLNFRDVLIAMGEHVAACLGNEAAGLVSRVGSDVSEFTIGDRVVFINGLVDGGCFKTFGRQSADAVAKIPDEISFEDAASLPCVYSTAIHGLYDRARLEKDESILIHAAAGGVGQAAIQLAQLVGAEVFATVSTPEKRDLLIKEYSVREDHIFSSRNLSFAEGVMRMTKNRGDTRSIRKETTIV